MSADSEPDEDLNMDGNKLGVMLLIAALANAVGSGGERSAHRSDNRFGALRNTYLDDLRISRSEVSGVRGELCAGVRGTLQR